MAYDLDVGVAPDTTVELAGPPSVGGLPGVQTVAEAAARSNRLQGAARNIFCGRRCW